MIFFVMRRPIFYRVSIVTRRCCFLVCRGKARKHFLLSFLVLAFLTALLAILSSLSGGSGDNTQDPCETATSLDSWLKLHPHASASRATPVCDDTNALRNSMHIIVPFYNLDMGKLERVVASIHSQRYPRTKFTNCGCGMMDQISRLWKSCASRKRLRSLMTHPKA